MNEQITALEREIGEKIQQLEQLRRANEGYEVASYGFKTLDGKTNLTELFGSNDHLLMIHNMGQGCRYCTLWADGFNGLLPHLESALSVVMVSKDSPERQRLFANARGWRFQMVSHGGGDYMDEQSVGSGNEPGAVMYQLRGGKIYRKNACAFGPGDLYCAAWPLLAMAGMGVDNFTPQFNYWRRPQQMDDGGQNLAD